MNPLEKYEGGSSEKITAVGPSQPGIRKEYRAKPASIQELPLSHSHAASVCLTRTK
jgi:hypothetical protein